MAPQCKSISRGMPCDKGQFHTSPCDWSETLDLYNSFPNEIGRLQVKIETLQTTINFFASCIKSGESWSPACQEMLDNTKKKYPNG
jgi:hypothetical protein